MIIRRASHAVYDTRYHLVWVPKYRKWILRGDIRNFVEECFKEIGMVEKSKIRFDGIEWLKNKGLYVNTYTRKVNLIERNLNNKQVVLDFGCEYGQETYYYSKFVKEIYGIDISGTSIEIAKEKYNASNLFYKVANTEQIPFENTFFDVVYSTWVIEHLKYPEKFICEAFRILKPKGVLILWVPNVKSFFCIVKKML